MPILTLPILAPCCSASRSRVAKLAEALSNEIEGQSQASEWPPGWIEATAGSIADPTFVRHPQGDYEQRDKLE